VHKQDFADHDDEGMSMRLLQGKARANESDEETSAGRGEGRGGTAATRVKGRLGRPHRVW